MGRRMMKPTRKLSRRSFLGRVAGGALVGGAALTVLGGRAEALQTDNDSGPNADPAGRGRGVTDNDRGRNADPAGRGRGTGVSDNDSGRNADPAGRGRGRATGVTDNDPSDPANGGRGGGRR